MKDEPKVIPLGAVWHFLLVVPSVGEDGGPEYTPFTQRNGVGMGEVMMMARGLLYMQDWTQVEWSVWRVRENGQMVFVGAEDKNHGMVTY